MDIKELSRNRLLMIRSRGTYGDDIVNDVERYLCVDRPSSPGAGS